MTPVEWLRRRWGAECPDGTPVPTLERCTGVDCDSIRLSALGEGATARVTCLEDPGGSAARKLAAFGVLPGVEIVLLQRSPAFVFRMGYAEFAVDAELAGHIRVSPGVGDASFIVASHKSAGSAEYNPGLRLVATLRDQGDNL